jgi:hypothetical protein
MSKFNRYMKIFLSTIAGVTLFVMAVQSGTGALERRPTDDESERLTIREAKKLANGEHSYGIVEYTHYPNGPQYVLALMVKGGIEDRMRLRAAPLVFSALGVARLGFCVCMTGASLILSALGIVGVASLLWQPGVIQWMGALYGNSYSLAICMAAAGVSLLPGGSSWPVFILGFLSGWMGYDFTFCFIGAVVVGRLLVVNRDEAAYTAIRSVFSASAFASMGVFVAIASHLAQNALYFGSAKAAFNDLIGSAAARAGLPIASALNPGYANYIRSAALAQGKGQDGEYSRWEVLADLWSSFISTEWTVREPAMEMFYGVLAVNACLVLVGLMWTKSWRFLKMPALVTALAILISVVSGVAWFLLMPQHARFHFHFIQRQFFVPALLVWLALWHMGNRLRSEIRGSKDQWRVF